jgi:hypothetical protein
VPDLQSAEGGVVQLHAAADIPVTEQLSDVLTLPQYDGQQTLSTKVQDPQAPAVAAG